MDEYENFETKPESLSTTEKEFIRLLRQRGEKVVNLALISQEQRSVEIQKDF